MLLMKNIKVGIHIIYIIKNKQRFQNSPNLSKTEEETISGPLHTRLTAGYLLGQVSVIRSDIWLTIRYTANLISCPSLITSWDFQTEIGIQPWIDILREG